MIVKRIRSEAKKFVKREAIMVIALFLALISSVVSMPKVEYIDFRVLSILFSLMLVVTGLKKLKVLDFIAVKVLKKMNSFRGVATTLVGLTFFVSMVVTNDVALLTFIPLAIIVGKNIHKDMAKVIILQTLAANLGSAFTPMGNPQNLFLYAHYGLKGMEFFTYTTPMVLFSFFGLLVLLRTENKEKLNLQLTEIKLDLSMKTWIFIFLLILNVLLVFHLVDLRLALGVTVLFTMLIAKDLFRYVDYSLLFTFIGFFIFIGNISQLDFIDASKDTILGTSLGVYISGIVVSQFISNVPAAMLLAGFTDRAKELILGVNVGGLGTLIASMASVISYKLYVANNIGQGGNYLKRFLFYNIVGLLVLAPLVWLTML